MKTHPHACWPAAACLLSLFFCLPDAARAQEGWKVVSSETLPAPAPGITHRVLTLARPANAGGEDNVTEATLHFVSFDSGEYSFRVLDQGPNGHASLAEVMEENHCLAGSNGGYFTTDFEPVGLLVCDGKEVHGVRHAKLLTGALIVTPNHITLRRSSDPLPGKHAREALQSGPFLVEGGKPVAGLNGSRPAHRTAVFTDGGRRWGLVSTTSLTLEELGAVLADPALTPPGLRITGALNLDGGGSTALWTQAPAVGAGSAAGAGGTGAGKREPFYLRELGSVRDFVGIVPHPHVNK